MKRLKQLSPAFGRFVIVGVLGTGVNLAALWVLVTLVGLGKIPAALLATEISIIHNFWWNDRWTFRPQKGHHHSLPARFGRFQVVTALTALFTLAIFSFLTGSFKLHYLLAQFVAIGLATLVNFAANARFTWRTLEPGLLRFLPAKNPGPETVAERS